MADAFDDGTVLAVMVEHEDGHRCIYGRVLFKDVADANKAKDEAEAEGRFRRVNVSRWDVV